MRSTLPLTAPLILFAALAGGCALRTAEPESESRRERRRGATAEPGRADLERLERWMTGTFSSRVQAERDPEDFFDIRLVMLPIWTERADGPWLYVEQAAARALDRPYRQRVYRLSREGDRLRSDVYELPGDPLEHAGAWREPGPLLAGLGPAELEPRTGCSILLERDGPEAFRGSTAADGCPSSLRGARFATSEVLITETQLLSWDRGWSAPGVQEWGSTEGPYEFDKLSSGPPEGDAAVD